LRQRGGNDVLVAMNLLRSIICQAIFSPPVYIDTVESETLFLFVGFNVFEVIYVCFHGENLRKMGVLGCCVSKNAPVIACV